MRALWNHFAHQFEMQGLPHFWSFHLTNLANFGCFVLMISWFISNFRVKSNRLKSKSV